MKKRFVYGTAVLALSVAPLLAQGGAGSGGTAAGSATGSQSGSSATGSQNGTSTPGTAARAAGGQSDRSTSANSTADHSFVMEAAQGGLAEVELGQLAGEKASAEPVKQFAQRMVSDHSKGNDELKSLAQSKNITLPTTLDAKHKATKDRLSKLSGSAFDRAYMQDMLMDHRKDVSDFRKESQSGKDPEVKAWAAKTLPTLEEHLKLAEEANRGAVGTSGKSSSEGNKTNGGTRGTTGTTGSGTGATTGSGGSTSAPGASSGAAGGSSSGAAGGSATGAGSTSGAGAPR